MTLFGPAWRDGETSLSDTHPLYTPHLTPRHQVLAPDPRPPTSNPPRPTFHPPPLTSHPQPPNSKPQTPTLNPQTTRTCRRERSHTPYETSPFQVLEKHWLTGACTLGVGGVRGWVGGWGSGVGPQVRGWRLGVDGCGLEFGAWEFGAGSCGSGKMVCVKHTTNSEQF